MYLIDEFGMQGIDEHVRQTGSHVEYESRAWAPAFNISLSLGHAMEELHTNISVSSTKDSDLAVWNAILREGITRISMWASSHTSERILKVGTEHMSL